MESAVQTSTTSASTAPVHISAEASMVAVSTESSVEAVAIVAHPHCHLYGMEVLQAKIPRTTICRLRPWRKYDVISERPPMVPTTVHARAARRARSSITTFIKVVLYVLQPKSTMRSRATSYFYSAHLFLLANFTPSARYPKRKEPFLIATLNVRSVSSGVHAI